MHMIVTLLNHTPLTLPQNRSLPRHISKPPNNLPIPIRKPIERIWNAHILTKLLHHPLRPPQIMSWYTGVQVVDYLELQATVHKVQPGGAVDIHGCSKHFLRKGFVDTEVCGRHCEVGKHDLKVHWCGD